MTFRKPTFNVGYYITDDLQIDTEVRAYITDKSFMKDPFGHLSMFHQTANQKAQSETLHHQDYFRKDDNLIRARQRAN